MKKVISLLAVFILISAGAQNFKYGVTGNFHQGSIVNVHDRSLGKYAGGLGVFGGVPLVENDVFDSAWLYLMGNLEYNIQGENAEVNTAKYGKQKYYLDYISFQTFVKYFFHRGNMKSDIFVFAGPRIEFLVKEKRDVDPDYDLVHYKFNHDDVVNKFGYGFVVGAGVKIARQWEAFIRYDQGFSKVYPNNPRFTYNRNLGIGINYYLNENWW